MPERSIADKIVFSTEIAFGSLVQTAQKAGLTVTPPMGLMYLETEQLTRDFQDACREILVSLGVKLDTDTDNASGGGQGQ